MGKLSLSSLCSVVFIAVVMPLLSGCTVVGGIFKTGYWVGILTVAAVLGIILYLVIRFSNSGTEHKS